MARDQEKEVAWEQGPPAGEKKCKPPPPSSACILGFFVELHIEDYLEPVITLPGLGAFQILYS